MPRYSYDRLSAQDASFLWAEGPNQPMHVGGLGIFDSEPLLLEGGGLDIDRFRQAVENVLHWIPRYRQKLDVTPVEEWPVWVDDRQFDIGYHIRHIALPRPGTLDQLKELTGRINSRALDRRHALWEIWVIEGLENGTQFALLNKIHHCMIDGAAGADLSQILMSPSPTPPDVDPVPYMPRPAPSRYELLRDSISLGIERPLTLARDLLWPNNEDEVSTGATFSRRLAALRDMFGFAITPASETPINGELGPHRRAEWLTMPMADVLELRRELECTVNDIVLTTVAGAMRRYLFRRRTDVRNIDFRVAAPVSTRSDNDDRRQGNHVSTWIVPLPLGTETALERLDAVRATTEKLKRSEAALAVDTIMKVAEFLPPALIARGTSAASGPANMIVTNVRGPQFPLFTVGCRMLGLYPMVPLLPGGGLGIALFSYDGKLCWGFNGDYELIPDTASFVSDIRAAFEELRSEAVSRFMDRRTRTQAPAPEDGAPDVEIKTERVDAGGLSAA